MRCLRIDLAAEVEASRLWPVWTDRGSGNQNNVAIWQLAALGAVTAVQSYRIPIGIYAPATPPPPPRAV